MITGKLIIKFVCFSDLTKSMMISLPALFAFSNILRVSIVWFPKTFTIGEAMIVAQSIVLYSVMIVARVFDDTVDDELDLITAVANVSGLLMIFLCLNSMIHFKLNSYVVCSFFIPNCYPICIRRK